ncbi:STAS/SEC14 domain-containing protein [uncultured Tateyamaria sp.]|uniref:STAS/SEC14 domain-containing protein n=1 Tax=uncultured Tateyamaria sp. TaxID=455651 RepID=UPI00261D3DC5|nr:STAS/SEC14 domain-containing protein [uncultured Tateyamaria sp.]
MFNTAGITQIATDRPDLYAFRISGKISDDAMEAMAEHMNAVFDAHTDKVDMLMIFDGFEGTEFGASWDWDVIKSRFRALSHVDRYVVVNAPGSADQMIDMLDSILPVQAETFDDVALAWQSLQARAIAA